MIVPLYSAAIEFEGAGRSLISVVQETHERTVQIGDVRYSVAEAKQLVECINAAIESIKNRNQLPAKKGPSE